APGAMPSPNPVSVTVSSSANPTLSASAQITVMSHVLVSVLPNNVTLAALGVQSFTASVLGSSNQNVVWQVQGSGGGTARVTSCTSANSCSAPLSSVDVSQPGSLSISLRNPDSITSNAVQFVIVAPGGADDVINLSSAAPAVTGKDITVVEPTTAGIDTAGDNLDLDVAAIGMFSTSNNSCSLGGNPIPLARPSSGTNAVDICLFSQAGFDTSMTYMISGPGDIAVIAKQPAGLGIIHLTLQIPATAAPGAR